VKIRLDLFLSSRHPELTRSRIRSLIAGGHVRVDGRIPAKSGLAVGPDSAVELILPALRSAEALPENIPLAIIFEDKDLVVLDKPAGLVTHPAPGHEKGTLVNALLAHCRDLSGVGGVARPGIVHRLDKGTSGVMVAAKNDAAHIHLARQFRDHTVGRVYLAAARGTPPAAGRVEKALGRHPAERKKIAVRPGGRRAVTEYRVVASRGGLSLMELAPGTGRTHQLRVHLASLGHPVAGDSAYGGGFKALGLRDPAAARLARGLARPALHALSLSFTHPRSGERLSFTAPPPADLAPLFDWLQGPSTRSG
jgi:23S rRNA pseudouridine1911/1915/1917 synthase